MKKIILSTAVSVFAAAVAIPLSVNTAFYVSSKNTMPFINLGETVHEDNIEIQPDTSTEIAEEKSMPEEEYIVGVVAAEMPASFETEALKAQAVAARTYAVNSGLSTEELIKSNGQAYCTVEEMKKKWGSGFNTYYSKIKNAVYATKGEIAVYNDEPILAVFHAISSGKTEEAQNVWSKELPYLKSVDSSGDETSSEYYSEKEIPSKTAAALLQEKYPYIKLSEANIADQMQILERTKAGYISKIQVGNMVLTGKQVREALSLRSSCFTFSSDGDNIIFKTKGYGHGAGMSQYGANYMAKQGKTYKEILAYYYSGTSLKKYY